MRFEQSLKSYVRNHKRFTSPSSPLVLLRPNSALIAAKQGLRINAVNPGLIATEMIDRLIDQVGSTVNDLASTVPMERMGQVEEIAQAVVFLCSDAASYSTGQPLVIDGGFTAN